MTYLSFQEMYDDMFVCSRNISHVCLF